MILVFFTYIVSAIAWGAILYQLSRVIVATDKSNRPPLLVPLAISSLAIFIESVYFGISSFFFMVNNNVMFFIMLQEENWFIIKLLIAVSGVLLLFNLKSETKIKRNP